jgi:DNA repair protein RadA/Sms
MRITEPALDLAMVAALISSHTGRAFDSKTVFFGEVGLVGEVRAVSQAERRISEAVKTGYTTIVLPESNRIAIQKSGGMPIQGAKLVGVKHIREISQINQ